MPATDDSDDAQGSDHAAADDAQDSDYAAADDAQDSDHAAADDTSDAQGSDRPATHSAGAAVTPYEVEGEVDYGDLLDRFGADRISDEQREQFPDPVHPLVRREVFYAERDLDGFLAAARAGEPHSIVTGVGPSGPLHLGHVFPFYFAKYLQQRTGATVYVPLSDDEKFVRKDLSLGEISDAVRENLRDLLAVGFDPGRTRIVVDTADADVIYPLATAVSAGVTHSTMEATYGEPPNVGAGFYPAVQATHLLLPQLVAGRQPTLVPIAVDQDPHVRVARDVAGKERYPVAKPAALLAKFLPGLDGPGKMSSSDDAPGIELDDDRETVHETVQRHAYSGGRETVAAHREHGGDPEVDVAFRYLQFMFEDDDGRLRELARQYRDGELLSGELKTYAADRIADFLDDHQARKADLGPLEEELPAYRLTDEERQRALRRVGYPDDALAVGESGTDG